MQLAKRSRVQSSTRSCPVSWPYIAYIRSFTRSRMSYIQIFHELRDTISRFVAGCSLSLCTSGFNLSITAASNPAWALYIYTANGCSSYTIEWCCAFTMKTIVVLQELNTRDLQISAFHQSDSSLLVFSPHELIMNHIQVWIPHAMISLIWTLVVTTVDMFLSLHPLSKPGISPLLNVDNRVWKHLVLCVVKRHHRRRLIIFVELGDRHWRDERAKSLYSIYKTSYILVSKSGTS